MNKWRIINKKKIEGNIISSFLLIEIPGDGSWIYTLKKVSTGETKEVECTDNYQNRYYFFLR